jgi:hypothetical protein
MNIDAKTNDLIDLLGFAPDSLSALAVKTALHAVRNEALEEAAKAAEGGQRHSFSLDNDTASMAYNDACVDVATAIRALKEGT